MIHMKANTRRAVALSDDLITTNSVGIEVRFLCSAAWAGLSRIAIFRGSEVSVDVILTGDSCTGPPEVLAKSGGQLLIGLYGTDGSGSLAIPTVWADAGRILQGAAPSGVEPSPAQKTALEQAIEALNNATAEIPTQIDTALAAAKASGEFDGADGATGPQGPKGDKGDSGEQGPKGDTGETGPIGPRGEKGDTGATGATGSTGPKGDKGDKGDAFTYEDFTAAQLAALTGPQGPAGPTGQKGDKGDPFEYGDFTPEQLAALTGPQGATGPAGPAGVGVPPGGTTGQVLAKASGTDYDTEWTDPSGGAAYFPFTISDGTVTPGTGVTPAAIHQAFDAGKAVFAVIPPELEIDDTQILPLVWINEQYDESTSIWFSIVEGNVSLDLIYSARGWHTQSKTLYQKPFTGIPKFDLASAVQDSLDKADSSIAAPSSPATGAFLVWNGTEWVAQTLATWQAGSY